MNNGNVKNKKGQTNMKDNLGLGVIINMLGGNAETVDAVNKCVNQTITSLKVEKDELVIAFANNTKLILWDDGQSCCEYRYMVCDDKQDLQQFVGATLVGFEIKEAPELPLEYGAHEVQFLDVKTSKGVFQCATHNEHNGYYGGFYVKAKTRIIK